jgi:hypothetical protein
MIWNGHELKTVGDIMTHGIDACRTREEAQAFILAYEAENPHARDNVGYLAGYYSREKANQIYEWFGVSHPIFGYREPTPEEAFYAGMKLAEDSKKYGTKKAVEMGKEVFNQLRRRDEITELKISEIIARNLGD